MPSLSLYIPLKRPRGLLLRLMVDYASRPSGERPVLRRLADLPDYLREDVGLPPRIERPPPSHHRVPF